MMQPNSFIRNPLGWLKRIASARATTTSVPTFALRYCVRRFNAAAMEGVDLSACRNIFIGGERVDDATLRDFAATFAPYGLAASALQPCYGWPNRRSRYRCIVRGTTAPLTARRT